ncbi:MAG: JHBP domain-containing protein [Gelidibacter sp.]|nr:JHBP domain-containing protein [Gelidibacter sp.]
MKKLLILLLAFTLNACNDGDFDVPVFEFTETVNKCGEYVLYITSTEKTEVLVLTLPKIAIDTIPKVQAIPILATVTATYRIFDKAIGTTYFCQAIPPSEPKIIKELKADGGTINITTSEVLKDSVITGYSHEITISKLSFNDGKERIFFESFNFGKLEIKN